MMRNVTVTKLVFSALVMLCAAVQAADQTLDFYSPSTFKQNDTLYKMSGGGKKSSNYFSEWHWRFPASSGAFSLQNFQNLAGGLTVGTKVTANGDSVTSGSLQKGSVTVSDSNQYLSASFVSCVNMACRDKSDLSCAYLTVNAQAQTTVLSSTNPGTLSYYFCDGATPPNCDSVTTDSVTANGSHTVSTSLKRKTVYFKIERSSLGETASGYSSGLCTPYP